MNFNNIILQEQPFDIMANTYDEDFSHTHIGKLQREKVWEKLLPVLHTYNRHLDILEINCGTGEDALRLAAMGHSVIATDASAVMIEKAKCKAGQFAGNNYKVQFIQCSFEGLQSHIFENRFDLVFSNFGGLNCIDEEALKVLSKTLSNLITPGGHLFFVLISRFCAWETGYYLLRGRFKTAFRRWQKQVSFTVSGNTIPVYYYSPASFKKLFHPEFAYINSFAVGLFVPPSYLEPFFLKRQALLGKLSSLENKLAVSSAMCRLSDHYCIVLKKNEQE